MDIIFITITGIIIIGAALAGMAFLLLGRRKPPQSDDSGLLLLQNQLAELSRTVDTRLGESQRLMRDSVREQFGESQRLIRDVNEQMVRHLTDVAKGVSQVSESSKQVFTVAEQLKNLEQVLTNQKRRGNLGEAGLELILSNILPATAYKLQYQFPGGEAVDAVIFTKEGMIPVDAKFSLDNYNRLVNESDEARREELQKEFKADLKKRIDETAKYIRTKDGTLPFAFMFIPAEGIYYDLLVNEVGAVRVSTRSLVDYAYKDKSVVIVSPTTFAAYLQSVLYGFRAFKIEESAKNIAKQVEDLVRHLKAYEDYHNRLGNSLATTVSHYTSASREFKKIDKDVLRITGKSADVEPPAIEKPEKGE